MCTTPPLPLQNPHQRQWHPPPHPPHSTTGHGVPPKILPPQFCCYLHIPKVPGLLERNPSTATSNFHLGLGRAGQAGCSTISCLFPRHTNFPIHPFPLPFTIVDHFHTLPFLARLLNACRRLPVRLAFAALNIQPARLPLHGPSTCCGHFPPCPPFLVSSHRGAIHSSSTQQPPQTRPDFSPKSPDQSTPLPPDNNRVLSPDACAQRLRCHTRALSRLTASPRVRAAAPCLAIGPRATLSPLPSSIHILPTCLFCLPRSRPSWASLSKACSPRIIPSAPRPRRRWPTTGPARVQRSY